MLQIIRQYARKYVLCTQCRQGHTRLRHDAALRLDFLDCQTCHATRCVAVVRWHLRAATLLTTRHTGCMVFVCLFVVLY